MRRSLSIAALFGRPECAKEAPLDEAGKVVVRAASPQLLQLIKDIESLEDYEEGAELLAEMQGRPLRLFREQEGQFQAISMHVIPAAY